MWHTGIDLHWHTVVLAAVHDSGEVTEAVRFACHACHCTAAPVLE
jgi:hypothetical protein